MNKEIIQAREDKAALAALHAWQSYGDRLKSFYSAKHNCRYKRFTQYDKNALSDALNSGLFRCFHNVLPSSDDVYKQDRQTLIDDFSASSIFKSYRYEKNPYPPSHPLSCLIPGDARELATKAVDACIMLLRK